MKTILPPIHLSEETAYLVEDYPYGFHLRCSIRYWLEVVAGKGTRLCSQTSNPKRADLVWNKPKKSTYSEIAGAMFLVEADAGHVAWDGLTRYDDASKCEAFLAEFRAGLTAPVIERVENILAIKKLYDAEKDRGEFGWQDAGVVASLVGRNLKAGGVVTLEKAREIVRAQVARRNAATIQV